MSLTTGDLCRNYRYCRICNKSERVKEGTPISNFRGDYCKAASETPTETR